jgi:hypothetical protein
VCVVLNATKRNLHRWASASSKLTPASAFRHLKSQFGTGQKNAGLRCFNPVPDQFRHRYFVSFRYRTDKMPDSPVPVFRHSEVKSRNIVFLCEYEFLRPTKWKSLLIVVLKRKFSFVYVFAKKPTTYCETKFTKFCKIDHFHFIFAFREIFVLSDKMLIEKVIYKPIFLGACMYWLHFVTNASLHI